jgi:hypothetical protein
MVQENFTWFRGESPRPDRQPSPSRPPRTAWSGWRGREIWGGAGFLMLGGVEIAQRLGYVPIKFHSQETFEMAIRGPHR